MAKDNAELYAMPQPQSRNEKYLNYLAGRAVDLNLLPDPQSRIEEYLEYLCYNRGAGGGGQQFVGLTNATINNNIITFYKSDGTSFTLNLKDLNLDKLIERVELVDTKLQLTKVDGTVFEVDLNPLLVADKIKYNGVNTNLVATNVQDAIDELNGKFIEDVTYDEARNRTIFKTKGGQQDIAVVAGLVTRWKHLEHVKEYPYINLFDIAKRQQGKQYGTNGQIVNSTQNWYIVEIDVEEDTEYTLMKMHNYNNGYKVVFFNSDGTYNSEDNNNAPVSNGWHRKTVRTPQGVTKVGLQFQYGISQLPRAKETMFLKGNVTENIDPFIPYADGNLIQVLKEVSLEFDNSNSNINSTTVESAIKELDGKIANAGGGTVTSVNNVQGVNGNVELKTTPTFDVNSMKLNTVGSNVEFTSIECYTDQDVATLIATLI